MRRRVAIIGAGFSGAVVAANLLRRGRHAPDVVLIERAPRFGPGLAYGRADPGHLLNVRASNMSALANEPDHFVRWLARHGMRDADACFAPRVTYGAYIEDTLARSAPLFGAKLKRIRGEATACRMVDGGWEVTLASGRTIAADDVVLALGHDAPTTPAVFEEAGIKLIDPWNAQALANIPRGDVLLLGAGLTMIDVALSLLRTRKRGTIYALSRRGLTPRPHLVSVALPEPRPLEVPVSLSEMLHAVRKEARAMTRRGEPWQHAVDRLRVRTPDLWRSLPLEAQRRFLRHLRPWWEVHRHRMPPEAAKRIAALQGSGRLRVLAGEIVSATKQGRSLHLLHRQRGSLVRHRMDVVAIVNCTGASLDPRQSSRALVRQLLGDGVARAHATDLGFDVDPDGRAIAADGSAQPNLYVLGPITQGAFWECIAAPEIRVRAAALAMRLAPDA